MKQMCGAANRSFSRGSRALGSWGHLAASAECQGALQPKTPKSKALCGVQAPSPGPHPREFGDMDSLFHPWVLRRMSACQGSEKPCSRDAYSAPWPWQLTPGWQGAPLPDAGITGQH